MARLLVLVALTLSSLGHASRISNQKVMEAMEEENADPEAVEEMDYPEMMNQLNNFYKATALEDCEECKGLLVGNLLEGVVKKNHAKAVNWDGTTLSAHLKHPVYGQVASNSRVPILWVFRQLFTATVRSEGGETTVSLQGLDIEPPAQGMHFYEAMLDYGVVNMTGGWSSKPVADAELKAKALRYSDYCPGDGCTAYLEQERKAARYYMKDKYKSDIKGKGKKLDKVIGTIRDSFMYNTLINEDNWANIFYSFVSAAPKTLDSLIFTSGGVKCTAHPNEASSKYGFFHRYALFEKAKIIGIKALKNTPKAVESLVMSKAASGWGFGMLFAHGDPEVASNLNYKLADPNNLVNLFSLCEQGEDSEDPPCSGSSTPGRLHWTATPPSTFE